MTKRAKPRAAAAVAQVWDEDEDQTAAEETPGTTEDSMDAVTVPDDDEEPTDEELGELIDGTEDEITDDFEEQAEPAPVAVAVDGDENPQVAAAVKAALAVAKKKKEVSTMASNKDMTKADHIRAEIEKRVAAGDSVRPRDIIAALEKKNVSVTAPQVSVLVKKLVSPAAKAVSKDETPAQKAKAAIGRVTRAATAVKKPLPAAEKKAAPKPSAKATKAPGLDQQQFEALFDAASFVEKCGGVENAINALSAYERLTATRA